MTVGFYCPLPPVRSGVADYGAALLGALNGDVSVGRDGDMNLYHMGNNELHREIHARALARPGVLVLHDAVLHHYYLGALSRQEYVAEFVHNYGDWHRGMAEELWAGRSRSASAERYFRWPMLRRLVERSLSVVVHNSGAEQMVLRHHAAARVSVIPHLSLPFAKPKGGLMERWRAANGVLPSHTLFGLCGFLRESKRVVTALRAFARLRAAREDVWLLVSGLIGSSDLARAVAPLLSMPGILREEYLDEEEFVLRMGACDAGLNLRFPAAGESSGITRRFLQLGKPVIVSETPENRELPEAACPRALTGPAEEESLLSLMSLLADSPPLARRMGRAGREWLEATSSLESAARLYRAALASADVTACR